jgi:hypothetical protein
MRGRQAVVDAAVSSSRKKGVLVVAGLLATAVVVQLSLPQLAARRAARAAELERAAAARSTPGSGSVELASGSTWRNMARVRDAAGKEAGAAGAGGALR